MPDHINRALFLDRDGVVNIEKNYVHRIKDFEFVPGIMDLCACALTLGFRIIIITNQAGIARGYYTVRDYDRQPTGCSTSFRCMIYISIGCITVPSTRLPGLAGTSMTPMIENRTRG